MKIKVLFATLALCVAMPVFAEEAPTLKDDVDADTKAAIEAAMEANKVAQGTHSEWIWAQPTDDMWSGSLQDNTQILNQAITMANEGKIEEAKKTAAFVEMAAKQGALQAEARKLGPADYGLE
ncbi:MAG: hypothetical protein R3E95_21825 [Thiolinea sp.]